MKDYLRGRYFPRWAMESLDFLVRTLSWFVPNQLEQHELSRPLGGPYIRTPQGKALGTRLGIRI